MNYCVSKESGWSLHMKKLVFVLTLRRHVLGLRNLLIWATGWLDLLITGTDDGQRMVSARENHWHK